MATATATKSALTPELIASIKAIPLDKFFDWLKSDTAKALSDDDRNEAIRINAQEGVSSIGAFMAAGKYTEEKEAKTQADVLAVFVGLDLDPRLHHLASFTGKHFFVTSIVQLIDEDGSDNDTTIDNFKDGDEKDEKAMRGHMAIIIGKVITHLKAGGRVYINSKAAEWRISLDAKTDQLTMIDCTWKLTDRQYREKKYKVTGKGSEILAALAAAWV
jgi:hypothetical protein